MEHIEKLITQAASKRSFLEYSLGQLCTRFYEIIQQDQHQDMRSDFQKLIKLASQEGVEAIHHPLKGRKESHSRPFCPSSVCVR